MNGFWLLISTALANPCPTVAPMVTAAEQAILSLKFDDARAQLDRASEALICGHVPTSADLARYWLADGAILHSTGAPGASVALGHARRVNPTTWVETYGPVLQEVWEQSSEIAVDGSSMVVVDPAPVGVIWVDGTPTGAETTTWQGRHLVQARWEGDDANLSRWVQVAANERAIVPSGWVAPALATVVETQTDADTGETVIAPKKKKRPIAPLVVGLTGVALAGVSWGLAERERGVMKQHTGTDPKLDAAYTRHLAFSGTAVGMFAVAATGVTLHFAL